MSNPSTAGNVNERMIVRIERALSYADDEQTRVLTYIKGSITPEAIEQRHEEEKSVGHLLAVAKQHLRDIERKIPKEDTTDA